MTSIKIDHGAHLPLQFRVFGVILIGSIVLVPIGLGTSFIAGIIGFLVVLVGVGFFSARDFVQLDLDKKTYSHYTQVWYSMKFGSVKNFESLEFIFINWVKQEGLFQSRGRSVSIDQSVYRAYVKFKNGDKEIIDEDPNKDKLLKRLHEYDLGVEIIDNTTTA